MTKDIKYISPSPSGTTTFMCSMSFGCMQGDRFSYYNCVYVNMFHFKYLAKSETFPSNPLLVYTT